MHFPGQKPFDFLFFLFKPKEHWENSRGLLTNNTTDTLKIVCGYTGDRNSLPKENKKRKKRKEERRIRREGESE